MRSLFRVSSRRNNREQLDAVLRCLLDDFRRDFDAGCGLAAKHERGMEP